MTTSLPDPFRSADLAALDDTPAARTAGPLLDLRAAFATLAAVADDATRPLAERFAAEEQVQGALYAEADACAALRRDAVPSHLDRLRAALDNELMPARDRRAAELQLTGYHKAAGYLAAMVQAGIGGAR